MNPEFLQDTTRLFSTRLGYPRDVAKVLAFDPLQATCYDASVRGLRGLLTG